MGATLTRHKNVYVYIPNLIGYARIACASYAFVVAFSNPVACVLAYFLGFVCDELDGRAARTFNQTSTLGAVLDMVTDRVATSCLLVILCMLYPFAHVAFLSLLVLDIFSHWFHMYSTVLAGSSTHKDIKSRSWLVRTYYKYRLFMGFCCVCCEVLYLALYLMHWPQFTKWHVLPLASPPEQLWSVLPAGLQDWWPAGLSLVHLVALAALPGVVIKQICNWVQLRTAMATLVEYDLAKME